VALDLNPSAISRERPLLGSLIFSEPELLPVPRLRHILDARLADVSYQNEGQAVLVRMTELINARTSARFGDGPRPARFLNCDTIACERVVAPDLCLWLRGDDVKCAVGVDCPHGAKRVGPRARERSRAGGLHGRAGTQKREQSACEDNPKRVL